MTILYYDFDFDDFADAGFEAEEEGGFGFGALAEALNAGAFCEDSDALGDAGAFGVFGADECGWCWLIPLLGLSFPCDTLLT